MEGRRSFVAAKAGGSSAAGGGNREKRRGGVPDYRLRRCNWRCGYDAGGSRRGAYRSGNQTDSNRGRLLRPSVGGIINRLSPEKTLAADAGEAKSRRPPMPVRRRPRGKGTSAPERLTNWLLHLLGKTRILFLCNRAAVLPVKTEEKKDFPKILENLAFGGHLCYDNKSIRE